MRRSILRFHDNLNCEILILSLLTLCVSGIRLLVLLFTCIIYECYLVGIPIRLVSDIRIIKFANHEGCLIMCVRLWREALLDFHTSMFGYGLIPI